MADSTAKLPIPTVQPATNPIVPNIELAQKPNFSDALANNNLKLGKPNTFSPLTSEELKTIESDNNVDLTKGTLSNLKAPGTLVGAANDPPPGPRYKTYIEVKIANKTYTNLDGDFLGSPKIKSSTRQYSHAEIKLNDPDEKIFKETSDQSECEVIIGFADGEKRTKLKGKIWSIGRIPPDCTVIMIVDPSAGLKGSTNTTNSAAEKPSDRPESTKTDAAKYWEDMVTPKKEDLDPFSKIAAELAKPNKTSNTQENSGNATEKPKEVVAASKDNEKFQASFKGQSPTFDKLIDKVKEFSTKAKGDTASYPTAERLSFTGASSETRLKFQNSTKFEASKGGEILLAASPGHAAALEAIMQGDVIVVPNGNTLKQVGPGQGEDSGVVVDYANNRAVFIGKPEITKRSPLQLSSGQGAITVVAPNIEQKTVNGATVVTPGKPAQHPTGNVKIPTKGDIKLDDPLSPGCPYTWGQMTRQGEFVPDLKPEHIEGAVKMSQYLTQFTAETGGTKWEITSWFRPSWYNLKVASSGANGPHTYGSAVDFWFEGYQKFYDKMEPSWEYGLAISAGCPSGEFCHIDLIGPPKRRWSYC
jgi:hypothetical protein